MKRILFVDDEKNILDGLRRMLHPLRTVWEMEFVNSGDAALLACKEREFDVVVSDLRMPGMDGSELLGHIRDLYPATARLVLSGYSDLALTAQAVSVAYRVLGKPCTMTDLRQAVERVCTLQDVLHSPQMRQVIGAIGELPSVPDVYMALSKALTQPDTSTVLLAGIIEQDTAMTAKILHIVNNGFFGFSRHACTLEYAVGYLGIDRIKTLALHSHAFSSFVGSSELPTGFCSDMQRHCQTAALIAATLPLAQDIKESTQIACLLHDVGKLVLASRMPKALRSILEEVQTQRCSETAAEERILGIGHGEIGAYLLGLWGIEGTVVEAIAYHHNPTRISHNGLDCAAAVYLADVLARQVEGHPDDEAGETLSPVDREYLEALGLLQDYPGFQSRALGAVNHQREGVCG